MCMDYPMVVKECNAAMLHSMAALYSLTTMGQSTMCSFFFWSQRFTLDDVSAEQYVDAKWTALFSNHFSSSNVDEPHFIFLNSFSDLSGKWAMRVEHSCCKDA